MSMVPGPTPVARDTVAVYGKAWDHSPDLEDDFFKMYGECETMLLQLLRAGPQCSVVIASGEAMVVLWGVLKSVIAPGDLVVCMGNGIFGNGFVEMAEACGARVTHIRSDYGEPLDVDRLSTEVHNMTPKLVTAVHCDTPSGVLNRNLGAIGRWCHNNGALFAVDFVASAFGADVRVDDWHIDLGMLGTQKVLSMGPDLGIATVSERAWNVIASVAYKGYDALAPFRGALVKRYFPYTPNWRAIAVLHRRLELLSRSDALQDSLERHAQAGDICRRFCLDAGLKLVAPIELCSPTCTAVWMPDGWTWSTLDKALRGAGVIVGGSYGDLAGRVWRIGHMGDTQCRELGAALRLIARVLKHGPPA